MNLYERSVETVYSTSAVVTLEYKVGKDTKKDKFTIVNETFSDKKAPTVKVSGGILSDREIEQKVTFTLSGDYDFTNKYVLAEVDPSIYYGKTSWIAGEIANACDGINTPIPVNVENGKASYTLIFNENKYITPGSYKLQLTLYTSNNGVLVPDTKAVTTTLKVTKSKVNGSYKPVAKVTLSAKDQSSVELKGTGKNIRWESYDELCNAMNTNGQPNKFTNYFELDEYNTLKIKDGVDISSIKKEDLTGYVSYSAEYGEETYIGHASGTVKITVTLKDAFVNKYSVSANSITADETGVATATFRANGKLTDIAYASAEYNNKELNIDKYICDYAKVSFILADTKAGSYPIDLYVVPAGSYYIGEIENLEGQAYNDAVKKYGTKIRINIRVNQDIGPISVHTELARAKAAAEKVSVYNEDGSDAQDWILQKAQEAVVDGYTVSVKEGKDLSIVSATINNTGSATLTLVVKDANGTDSAEAECKWIIETLYQCEYEAELAAKQAIDDLKVTSETTSDDVLNAVKAVIKTSIYDAEWNKNNDPFWKGKTSIQGTIHIIRRADDEIVGSISVNKTITTTE